MNPAQSSNKRKPLKWLIQSTLTLTVSSCLFHSTGAHANCEEGHSGSGDASNKLCLKLGGAVAAQDAIYFSDMQSAALPLIFARYGNLYWNITDVGFYFLGEQNQHDEWALSVQVSLPNDGFKTDNKQHLLGINSREPTLEGGLLLSSQGAWGTVNLSVNTDLEQQHDGFSMRSDYSYTFKKADLSFTPKIEWQYREKKSANYYFGLNPDEAAAANSQPYQINGSINSFSIGYTIDFNLSERISLFHSLTAEYNDSFVGGSPLTVDKNNVSALAGTVIRIY